MNDLATTADPTYIFISTLKNALREETGNKFYQLSLIHALVSIPEAVCLRNSAFTQSLLESSKSTIQELLRLLESNGGYQLNRIQKAIQKQIDKITIPKEVLVELREVCERISDSWKYPLIIRSSSSLEDRENASGAGIYRSIGNVKSLDEVLEAIQACWVSSFSLAAIAHRLRLREFNLDPLPGVIIQRFIPSSYTGVTFSQGPLDGLQGIFIEYTNKADGVESGTADTESFLAVPKADKANDFVISDNDLGEVMAKNLVATAIQLRNYFGYEIEYEWGYTNGEFYVFQVRPITTLLANERVSARTPVCKVFDLYQDIHKVQNEDLGDIRGIFAHSIKKRKQIRDYAEERGIRIYGASIVITNKAGLFEVDIGSTKPLSRLNTPLLTVDVGPYLRSFYSKRADLNDAVSALTSGAMSTVPLIIREFASGDYSAVSTLKKDRILVEVCRGSLIGINRGFVDTQSFLVHKGGQLVEPLATTSLVSRYYGFDEEDWCFKLRTDETKVPPVPAEALSQIAHFTEEAAQKFGPNMLEWTIIDGIPIYIDNTPDVSTQEEAKGGSDGVRFLSPGKLSGEVLCVTDLERLEYISCGPTLNVSGFLPTLEANKEIVDLMRMVQDSPNTVIISKYPYTALSVLVGKVRGFIFESGPLLCHLAIISRETKTPVALVPNALSRYKDGDHIDL